MLQAFPGQFGRQRTSLNRPTNSVTYTGTSVTSGGTIGTYGATWTQVIAATPYDATALRLTSIATHAASAARGDTAVIIGTGGAGVEVQKIGPLILGGRPAYSSTTLPIFIPANTRISLKLATGQVSRALTFSIDILGGPTRHLTSLPTAWVAYGTNVSSGVGAYGTILTPGSSNSFGAWASLGTSARSHDLWLPMIGAGTGTSMSGINYRVQYALGSTTEAATQATNGTGVFEAPWLSTTSGEVIGMYATGSNPIHQGSDDVIYAPRLTAAALSVRAMAHATADANALSGAVLAAVK